MEVLRIQSHVCGMLILSKGRMDTFLASLGFTKSMVDPNLCFKVMDNEHVILLLCVDDSILDS